MNFLMIGVTYFYGKAMARKLIHLEKSLTGSSEQVIGSSNELSGASDNLAQASIQQAASLQETVSAMEEISSMVGKNLENTQNTAAQSAQMDQDAKKGKAILGKLSDHLNESGVINSQIKSEMEQSNHEIEGIINLISVISDKTRVINDIVFQTKLLSFNASVEAARAGEHGKGFSVVAQEVGRLATMSGTAAEEINANLEVSKKKIESIIAEVQKKTDSLISRSGSQTHECIKVSKDCQTVFESLLERMSNVNSSITEISIASQEQTQGISEIKKAMEQLDQVTQQNSATATEVRALSAGLADSSNKMHESVNELTVMIQGSGNEDHALASLTTLAPQPQNTQNKKVA